MSRVTPSRLVSSGWAAAFYSAITLLAQAHPAGWSVLGANGTELLISGSQMSSLNGVFARDLAPDAAEIARLAPFAAAAGLPWSIAVRGEPTPEILEIARRHGRTARHDTPMLVCPAESTRLRGGDTSRVRQITSADREVFAATLAAGFNAPASVIRSLMVDELIDPPFAAYLVELGGIPVATGFGIRTGDHIGVYDIAVLPRFRGRGFGRLVTERVMLDGFAAGATTAYLQSSSAGRPLYESMGFRTLETWTYLT
jgi:N-acetylglutamate synthase